MEISYLSDEYIDYKRSFQQEVGDCQNYLEQFEASIVSYKKALELADSSSGSENSKNTNKEAIMHNMATSYWFLNNLEEAINWYKQSLKMMLKRPDSPAKHYAIAKTLNSIGACYDELGKYQKALDECYEKAREHLQGAEDDQATKQLKSMWSMHGELGLYEKSLEAYKNDLVIQKEINASAEVLASTLNYIAGVLSAQGEHEEALEKYKESFEKKREHSGQDAKTLGIAITLSNIGLEYRHLKNYPEAGKWLRNALAMNQSVHCGNHPETANTLITLGCNYHDQGDLKKAQTHWQKAHDMLKTCEGNEDLKSMVLHNLGLTYRDQGDLNKAKDLIKQAYDMIMACEGHDDLKSMFKENFDKIEKMLSENQ
jgi:tetratricopeptide (TPR) repeat protein